MQSTIAESAEISGVELHGGKFTNLKMLPAEVNERNQFY